MLYNYYIQKQYKRVLHYAHIYSTSSNQMYIQFMKTRFLEEQINIFHSKRIEHKHNQYLQRK